MRIWYWEYRKRKGKSPINNNEHKIVTRKFHIPERLYLAGLVGMLEVHDYHDKAQKIRDLMPLEPIELNSLETARNIGAVMNSA